MSDINKAEMEAKDTIEGHKVCQTNEANWLCLKDVYNHFQRPNFYDIGGTYNNELAGFWFLYKTEQVSKLYILHIYVCNRQEGSFSLSLCDRSVMRINEQTSSIYLDSLSKVFRFDNLRDSTYSYLTTYSFSDFDVELMKDKKLFIAITINNAPLKESQILMNEINCLHDFEQLLLDPVGADFTMVSADGVKFPVHKLLLAARSEVFKAMLKEDTAESINNLVTIDDVNNEDLSCIIEFIYTGTVKNIEGKNCFNLLMLGDRYDIKGLKELSQHVLAQMLNSDNVLDTLIAADMSNSVPLKASAFRYIKKNIAILDSSTFHEINNVRLVQELCKYLAMQC